MFVSSRFRDFLGSDPTTEYLSELTAAVGRIGPFAGEGDALASDEPSREQFAGSLADAEASTPVFIPAPVLKSEFIPAPACKPEFIPAREFASRDS